MVIVILKFVNTFYKIYYKILLKRHVRLFIFYNKIIIKKLNINNFYIYFYLFCE